ncbi:MAG: PD-(D/E)XK nuclease family protein, partial [Alistipes sp.]|nr:PD-(D/E)XK nuclease family protein [Alistipes sp.]
MSTFLLELAEHLRNSYKNDLSKLVVMFPSLRARAFFNDALSSVSQDTIWQPHYTSIDEVMERASGLKRVDQIRLLGELYNVYKERFPNETFDHFYHWGCVLISDFDMIDKYMVNAKLLLVNLSDLKELEADVSYLTKEQKDIIKSFWSN